MLYCQLNIQSLLEMDKRIFLERRKYKGIMLFSESYNEIYQSIFEHHSDAIFVLSLDGKIAEVNSKAAKILGYSKEEVQGIYFKDLMIPMQAEEINCHFSQVLKGVSCENKFDAYHKNGEILHLQMKSTPLLVQNEIVGMFLVVKDLSGLQKTRNMKEGFKAVFNSSADAIDILDLEGNIIDVNKGFENLYGWKREEVIGKPLPIVPKYRLTESKSFIERAKLGEEIKEFDVACIRKDGTPIDISLTFSPIRDSNGKVVAVSGIARDMTEQKRLRIALMESEERYRLFADNSLDLIQLVDLDGIVTYASPSHQTVLGHEPSKYVGKWVFYQPNTGIDETFKEIFLNMALTQTSFTHKLFRRHKKGHGVWLEMKGKPMLDKEGNYKYMMLVGHEITEQKKLQKHLEYLSFHDVLTGIPNRRLFEEKLEQALKEARQYQRKLAVMYMDMDKFKQINDTFGHEVGDKLLKQFSKKVKSHLQESDTFARQGGDEFTILLSEVREETDALNVAERILISLQEPWQIGDHIFQTTSSIGIAFYPKDGSTKNELMKHADVALYKAKEVGRNNYQAYSYMK